MPETSKTPLIPNPSATTLEHGGGSEIVDCGAVPDTETINEWPVLLVLAAVQFVHILDFMMIMPLGPAFFRLFEITPKQFGLLVTVYTFSAAVCSFLVAFIVDRFDRKHALIVLCSGFMLAMLLCAASVNYQMLLYSRAIAGMFGGLMSATVFSIIADLIPEWRRGKATGTVMSSFSFVAVAGMPACLFLVGLLSWRAPFIVLAILSFIIIFTANRLLPPVKTHIHQANQHGPAGQLKNIFMNRNHIFAFLLIGMLMFSAYLVIPFISTYMVTNVGMHVSELPYLYFFGGLFSFFTANLFGRFTDRYGRRVMFGVLAMLSLVPVLWITHISEAPLFMALTASTLFMILVTGRIIPLMALVTTAVRPHLRGSFMTFHMSIQQLSAGLGSLLAGSMMVMTAHGKMLHYDTVGTLAAFITVIGILLVTQVRSVEEIDAKLQ
ncbi:Predicted arabinose efflux permease, MFS family [Nitrosomonas marina]|uniref:Predicted arabinose efflux permease, MFS family n=1 Tax=Nitrosomonas marina TaxID=917 RepID=A0A1H9ZKK4_9PROT|nr:MFS transporter [Nitrosomonas marina]SES82230.1 Predicted arabinose efflux permease, MFS family [Nitrosomonas marina]